MCKHINTYSESTVNHRKYFSAHMLYELLLTSGHLIDPEVSNLKEVHTNTQTYDPSCPLNRPWPRSVNVSALPPAEIKQLSVLSRLILPSLDNYKTLEQITHKAAAGFSSQQQQQKSVWMCWAAVHGSYTGQKHGRAQKQPLTLITMNLTRGRKFSSAFPLLFYSFDKVLAFFFFQRTM